MKKIHIIPTNGNITKHSATLPNCLEHRVFISSQKGFTVLTIKDIYYVKAAGAESIIYSADCSKGFTVPISITEIQNQLSGVLLFFRSHRSYLVNLHHLKACFNSDGVLMVSVCPGTQSKELPIADKQRNALRDVLQSLGWQEVKNAR